jgi:hypothetical protein
MGFSLCPERGHEGRIREVPREDRCSSMYLITHCCLVTLNIHVMICMRYLSSIWHLSLPSLFVQDSIHNINWCLFFAG